MIKFIFILTVWHTSPNYANVYVQDYNLSGRDCINRMVEYVHHDPKMVHGQPSCEIQQR